MTNPSVEIHLQIVRELAGNKSPGGFTPIGEIVSHLVSIVTIQEHRISSLEREVEEIERR